METRVVVSTTADRGAVSGRPSRLRWLGRAVWLILRLLAALLVMERGSTFFYQGF